MQTQFIVIYTGYGFEIAARSSNGISPEQALEMWKSSCGHHAGMMNIGMWRQSWSAIDIGIYQGYALVWFGHEEDSTGNKRFRN